MSPAAKPQNAQTINRRHLRSGKNLSASFLMAKGDDAITKKRNKANRKKLNRQRDSSSVSARVAAVIAAKKRRKLGKRRMCQGMCFSLPTPDDPFNDRQGKKDLTTKETKKQVPSRVEEMVFVNAKGSASRKKNLGRNVTKDDNLEQKNEVVMNLKNEQKKLLAAINNGSENSYCPSKFLISCLNSIEIALRHDSTHYSEEDRPLFVNTWGVEFWKCYSVGKDILETSGACSNVEQIAWIASTGADTIARKEQEGLCFPSPFLLFIVPSQKKAVEVRSLCKPLKALGIHTVSLHPGAPLDHQSKGLKSCEPEFLVSTPERLLELVSLKVIDISRVSFLVIDGLETLAKGGHLETIKSIRLLISGNPRSVVFNDCFSYASVPAVQNLMMGSICRLSLNDSIASQSACIIQSVNVCTSEEEKLSKGIQVLDQAYGNQVRSQPVKVLYIVGKDSKLLLAPILKLKGYSISTGSLSNISEFENSSDFDGKLRPAVSLISMEHISTAELGEYEFVIIPKLEISIENYVHVLTRMARHTVSGVLYSFFSKENASLAGPLIKILEQCGQAVPDALRKFC